MRIRFSILLLSLIVASCTFTANKNRISAEEALKIAQREYGDPGKASVRFEGGQYIVHFEGEDPSNGPMIGGGGGFVYIDAYSGEIINKIFLE